MASPAHNIFEHFRDNWELISGGTAAFVAAVKIWWTVRKAKEKRISALEILAEHWVTREDLHACREDVRATDDKNLEIVFNEIKGLRKEVTTLVADNRKENTSEHNEIKGIIIDKLSGQ